MSTKCFGYDYRTGHAVRVEFGASIEAVDELVRCAGTQFSPRVVEALVRLHERGELQFVQPDADDNEDDKAA